MGELGSDFSLGGERGIERVEEKETSTNLCSWVGQHTLYLRHTVLMYQDTSWRTFALESANARNGDQDE